MSSIQLCAKLFGFSVLLLFANRPALAEDGYGIGGVRSSHSISAQRQAAPQQGVPISPTCTTEEVQGGTLNTCTNAGVTVSCLYPRNGGPAQCFRR